MPVADLSLIWIAWIFASLLACHWLPSRWRMDVIAAFGFLFLARNSPDSCVLLSLGSLLTAFAVRQAQTSRAQWPLFLVVIYSCAILVLHGLQVDADQPGSLLKLVGAGYFACRQMHVAFEAYAGRLAGLSLREQLRYQFFLPTLLVGPIHRIKPFTRACVRLREQPEDFFSGIERALIGAAKVSVLANMLLGDLVVPWIKGHAPPGFLGSYLSGAVGWVVLYLTFSGYSDMAIGFARSTGIAIEENFNRPWLARNLIEFWQRWHMTLSGWCRDYVYSPLAAATRRHGVALLAAMLVMGAWHELSLYYVLWGFYHASGIALCRVLQHLDDRTALSARFPAPTSAAARVATFAWLAGGAPTITLILHLLGRIR
jgi:alginate O-acetyltransferase complex protein AlgI